MKTITEYREELRALKKAAGDISAKATVENRDPTPKEVSLKNEILDKMEELEGIIGSLEREERISARLEGPASAPASRQGPQARDAGPSDRPQDRFGSLGEQMAAVMRAGVPGGHVDPRLFRAAASGLSESVPSDGGFMVQQDFTTQILEDTYKTGLLASRVRQRIQISGNANGIKINGVDETSRATGSRQGGITGYWADEAGEKTASKPKFRKIELNLKKLVGLCYATDELLDDAAALEGIIRNGFPAEFGFQLDDALFNGTGAGQPLGIMNAGSLVSVAKEAGQAAKTVIAENVINMRARLLPGSRATAAWFINQEVETQLPTLSLAVGTGGVPIFLPAGSLAGNPYDMLLGMPIVPIEQCAALGTVGDIVLGDFANGYVLGEKGGIKSDVSIHVRFVYDESVFRFVLRVDGQPVRASALTPYKGTNTLSHFVALATRA